MDGLVILLGRKMLASGQSASGEYGWFASSLRVVEHED